MKAFLVCLVLFLLVFPLVAFSQDFQSVRINTQTAEDRTQVADSGAAIHYVHPSEGWVLADLPTHRLATVESFGFKIELHDTKDTFPSGYEAYHDYAEQVEELENLHALYPSITDLFTVGASHEDRALWCLKISDNADQDEPEEGAIVIVALHHAREILSPEVALYTARTLLESYDNDEMIRAFIDNREIFILPTLNPDGGEYDHAGTSFRFWRKNRSPNDGSSCKGVDLNRNYGFKWGGAGSTGIKCDLTYHGPQAFSEPETQALRDLVLAHENINVLISLHTYSELILYPWGYRFEGIEDPVTSATFETLAQYMADQNGYTPQQSSRLYRTTGDTTDWAYGELGLFAFTFELSPSSPLGGMFYPKPDIFEKALPDNFAAFLLAIGLSNEPTRVLSAELWKLEARIDGDDAVIDWASVVETDATGWNVLRSDSPSSGFSSLNEALLPAGAMTYSFRDSDIEPGVTYNYMIEFVSKTGNDQQFGPLSISVPSPNPDDDDDDAVDDDDDDDDVPNDDDSDDDAQDNGCCG